MNTRQDITSRIGRLFQSPLYNFFSITITILSILILGLPVIYEFTISTRDLLQQLDRWVLAFFLIESGLHLLSRQRKRYIRSFALGIDFLVVLPLLVHWVMLSLHAANVIDNHSLQTWETLPGILLLKGIRGLRLLHSIHFFSLQRKIGLIGERHLSTIKLLMFRGTSTILFLIILGLGLMIAFGNNRLTETRRSHRKQQIIMQARTYGALQARLLFESYVMSVWITRDGERREIRSDSFPDDAAEKYYQYGSDYEQIDEINPGESIRISYRDLNRNRMLIELMIVSIGVLAVVTLLISLNHYLEKLILLPVERAITVQELRMNGEEIEFSEVPQEPHTELIRYINLSDLLYRKMRAPARQLLEYRSQRD